MKKSLIALAVMAASGAAMAQSSVTIWGIVDAAYTRATGDTNSRVLLNGSGISSTQLGFRGVEDLGGGMRAAFWLEAGFDNTSGAGGGTTTNNLPSGAAISTGNILTTGTATTQATNGTQGLTFNRRSTVSLIGGFGEIRLGRDYTPQFWNWTAYDPFGTNGVGTNRAMASSIAIGASNVGTTGTAVRASNSITYLYNHGPNATYAAGNQGLHAAVQTYFGENLSNAPGGTGKDGSGSGIRVGYNAGPVSVAVATGTTKFAAGNVKMTNYAGAYDMGVARVMAQITKDQVGAVSADGMLLGVTAPMGAGLLRASYSTYENNSTRAEVKQTAFGYIHNLSKRTRAYATYSRVNNSNGASAALGSVTGVANKPSSGIDIGMTHAF
jgi:predicted porin